MPSLLKKWRGGNCSNLQIVEIEDRLPGIYGMTYGRYIHSCGYWVL